MGDPIAEMADYPEISMGASPTGRKRHGGGCAWKSGIEMMDPYATVLAGGEYLLPEGEFEFSDDFPRGGLSGGRRAEVLFGVVVRRLLGLGEAAEEAIGPWPSGAVDVFDGLSHAILHGDLADLERHDEGG